MQYILKNKDKNVLEFEVEKQEQTRFGEKEYFSYIKNINIIEPKLLPLHYKEGKLKEWIQKRKVPDNRAFVDKIIATYSNNSRDFMDYIDVSLALSLNDSFWIVPADKDYKWKDYNLYENDFSEALALVAFSGISNKISGFTSSPEFTTNGMLRKCWHREDDKIYLYKGQSQEYANMGKEAYCEFYFSQIAKLMNFNAISYDLKLFHNEIISSCLIFTSDKEGYVPMYVFLSQEEIENVRNEEVIQKIMKLYGKEAFEDLMVFDALIANKDRHLGNFGMIINNDTNELLREAPIFDNGWGILNFLTKDELKEIDKVISEIKSYLDFTFDTQLKLFIQPRHKECLEKLKNFTFKRHETYNLSEEWLRPIENFIRQRAIKALEFIEEKQANAK